MQSYGYTIRRISAPGEPFDPCSPLEFYPPKGSDELHEALKAAFPFEHTLQARMRQAVINFHLSEAQADFNTTSDEYLPSPQSTFMSNVPSPSNSVPAQQRHDSTSRLASNPPAQEELMDVWSLPSKPNAKIHTRRNMTPEEKKAYKLKRLAGACADCKRRRRKCDHDASSRSPTQSGSRKVKARKRSPVAEDVTSKNFATTSTSFTAAPVPGSSDFSFTAEQNFYPFSGFDTSMPMDSFDMSVDMSFDETTADLGFDLGTDFALFPDLATSTNVQDTGMDATGWLTGSPDSMGVLESNSATTHDFSNWPTSYYDAASTVPPTPQSMLMTPMSRSQSGQSLPGNSTSANALLQSWPSASQVALNDRSSVFVDDVLFSPRSANDLERSDQRSLSTASSSDGLFEMFTPQSGGSNSPSSPFVHGQEEHGRLPSSQLGSALPPDRTPPARQLLPGNPTSVNAPLQSWSSASRVALGESSSTFVGGSLHFSPQSINNLERIDLQPLSTTSALPGNGDSQLAPPGSHVSPELSVIRHERASVAASGTVLKLQWAGLTPTSVSPFFHGQEDQGYLRSSPAAALWPGQPFTELDINVSQHKVTPSRSQSTPFGIATGVSGGLVDESTYSLVRDASNERGAWSLLTKPHLTVTEREARLSRAQSTSLDIVNGSTGITLDESAHPFVDATYLDPGVTWCYSLTTVICTTLLVLLCIAQLAFSGKSSLARSTQWILAILTVTFPRLLATKFRSEFESQPSNTLALEGKGSRKSSPPPRQLVHRRHTRSSCSKSFSALVQQTVCWLGPRLGSVKSASGILC